MNSLMSIINADSKKKLLAKKMKKKHSRKQTVCEGISIADMTREQLEPYAKQLQEDMQKIKEERNDFQIERDKIQSFWDITKQQLEHKEKMLLLKDQKLDEAAIAHLAEIKLYQQKMKHLMTECQELIEDKTKETAEDKLLAEQKHLVTVRGLEQDMNELKNKLSTLEKQSKEDIEDLNKKHNEQLLCAHQEFEVKLESLKSKEHEIIEKVKQESELEKESAIQQIKNETDASIKSLVDSHDNLVQKMKNYYNGIIQNDILIIRNLKEKLKACRQYECSLKNQLKDLETKNDELQKQLKEIEETISSHRGKANFYERQKNEYLAAKLSLKSLQKEVQMLKWDNDELLVKMKRAEMIQNDRDKPRTQSSLCLRQKSISSENIILKYQFKAKPSPPKNEKNFTLISPVKNQHFEKFLDEIFHDRRNLIITGENCVHL